MDVSGRLCFLEVALSEHINELLEEGHRRLVLNLADVPYIDSFGLCQLISIRTSIGSRGGQLVLITTDRSRPEIASAHEAGLHFYHVGCRSSGRE